MFSKLLVLSCLVCFLTCFEHSSPISLSIHPEALHLIEPVYPDDTLPNFLPDLVTNPSNITHLKLCLMKDAAIFRDPKAYELLGRYSMFGYPEKAEKEVSPPIDCEALEIKKSDEEEIFNELVKNDDLRTFKRDYQLALHYLMEAHRLGSSNAPVYIYFLMSQYFLIEDIAQSISLDRTPSPKALRELLIIGSNRGSFIARQFLLQEQKMCRMSESEEFLDDFKDILRNRTQPRPLNYLYGPLEDINCLKCHDALVVGIEAAHTAIEHLQETGGEGPVAPLLENLKDEILHSEEKPVDELAIIKQSAAGGNANAQVALGETYFFGNPQWGVERNLELAREYFENAAEYHANPNALHNIGLMYAQGIGVEKNGTKAKQYFERAVKLGSVSSYSGLAYLHLNGLGVEKNYTKTVEYFKMAADHGDPEAMSNLGAMYMDGKGVKVQNASAALSYFKKAAGKKQLSSMLNLAVLYARGIQDDGDTCDDMMQYIYEILARMDKTESLKKAITLYKKGDIVGAYLLNAFASGLGIAKANKNIEFLFTNKLEEQRFRCRYGDANLCRVIFLYKLILHKENSVGQKLGDLLFYGSSSFDKDYSLALNFYELASGSNAEAKYSVAYMYEHGLGVKKNLTRAVDECNQILKGVKEGSYSLENIWPTMLYKGKLWVKQSSIWNYIYNDSV